MTDEVWKAQKGILFGAALTSALLAFGIILLFASGNTFGQRCSRAYPKNGLMQERCVVRLSKGLEP